VDREEPQEIVRSNCKIGTSESAGGRIKLGLIGFVGLVFGLKLGSIGFVRLVFGLELGLIGFVFAFSNGGNIFIIPC